MQAAEIAVIALLKSMLSVSLVLVFGLAGATETLLS